LRTDCILQLSMKGGMGWCYEEERANVVIRLAGKPSVVEHGCPECRENLGSALPTSIFSCITHRSIPPCHTFLNLRFLAPFHPHTASSFHPYPSLCSLPMSHQACHSNTSSSSPKRNLRHVKSKLRCRE